MCVFLIWLKFRMGNVAQLNFVARNLSWEDLTSRSSQTELTCKSGIKPDRRRKLVEEVKKILKYCCCAGTPGVAPSIGRYDDEWPQRQATSPHFLLALHALWLPPSFSPSFIHWRRHEISAGNWLARLPNFQSFFPFRNCLN